MSGTSGVARYFENLLLHLLLFLRRKASVIVVVIVAFVAFVTTITIGLRPEEASIVFGDKLSDGPTQRDESTDTTSAFPC